jgi:hypothetical protein
VRLNKRRRLGRRASERPGVGSTVELGGRSYATVATTLPCRSQMTTVVPLSSKE